MVDTFEFTDQDLLANRANKLTSEQHKKIATYIKISNTSTRLALIACGVSIVAFFGIAYRLRPVGGFGQALPFLILAAILFIAIFVFFIVVGIVRSRDLNKRHISVIEGYAARSTQMLKHGRWTAYYVIIAKVRFQLPSQEQFEFFRDDTYYRVFYIQYPPAHLILTAEQIKP